MSLTVFSCLLLVVNNFQMLGADASKITTWHKKLMLVAGTVLATTTMVLGYDQQDAQADYQHYRLNFLSKFNECYHTDKLRQNCEGWCHIHAPHFPARKHEDCVKVGEDEFAYRHIRENIGAVQQDLLEKIPDQMLLCLEEKKLVKIDSNGAVLRFCPREEEMYQASERANRCEKYHWFEDRVCRKEAVANIFSEIAEQHKP